MPATDQNSRDAGFRLDTFLPYKLVVVTDCISDVFAGRYEQQFKLTVSEWRVLATVAAHETLSPTAVGRLAAMDKVKVSRAAQSLAAKGMLRQNKDPRDGRGRLLKLTRKGTAAHEGMVPLAMQLEAEVFGGLTRADLTALTRILGKVSTHLETNGAGGSAGAGAV